jgi:hypothetical protein
MTSLTCEGHVFTDSPTQHYLCIKFSQELSWMDCKIVLLPVIIEEDWGQKEWNQDGIAQLITMETKQRYDHYLWIKSKFKRRLPTVCLWIS